VFRDAHGIVYLRVEMTKTGALFVVNKNFHVDLIEMHAGTCRDLYLRPVGGASVWETANRLLHPIHDQSTIAQRAKEHLISITQNEEIQNMSTKKNAKPAKFASITAPAAKGTKKVAAEKPAKAAKTAAPKKAAASNGDGRARYAGKKIKVLNKQHGAREGTKRAQGLDIILGSKTTDDALPKLAKIGADPSFIRFAVEQKFISLS
jgi:hypothetical protein